MSGENVCKNKLSCECLLGVKLYENVVKKYKQGALEEGDLTDLKIAYKIACIETIKTWNETSEGKSDPIEITDQTIAACDEILGEKLNNAIKTKIDRYCSQNDDYFTFIEAPPKDLSNLQELYCHVYYFITPARKLIQGREAISEEGLYFAKTISDRINKLISEVKGYKNFTLSTFEKTFNEIEFKLKKYLKSDKINIGAVGNKSSTKGTPALQKQSHEQFIDTLAGNDEGLKFLYTRIYKKQGITALKNLCYQKAKMLLTPANLKDLGSPKDYDELCKRLSANPADPRTLFRKISNYK